MQHVCAHMCVRACVCVNVCTCVRMCLHVRVYICTSACVCVFACVCARMHTFYLQKLDIVTANTEDRCVSPRWQVTLGIRGHPLRFALGRVQS